MRSLQLLQWSSRPARVRAVIRVVLASVGVGAFALALSLSSSGAQAAPRPSPTPPIIATPVPTPGITGSSPSHSSGGPFGFLNPGNWLPDPKQWAADVFSQVLVTFLQSIASGLRSLVNGVMGSNLNFITRTPPAGTYNSPTVHTLWNVVRGIADAALVIVAMMVGFNVMTRQHLGSPYHEAMEAVPRLIVGALLVNTSMSWGQLTIDLNNAFCGALGQTALPAWQHADTITQALVNVIATLLYLVICRRDVTTNAVRVPPAHWRSPLPPITSRLSSDPRFVLGLAQRDPPLGPRLSMRAIIAFRLLSNPRLEPTDNSDLPIPTSSAGLVPESGALRWSFDPIVQENCRPFLNMRISALLVRRCRAVRTAVSHSSHTSAVRGCVHAVVF